MISFFWRSVYKQMWNIPPRSEEVSVGGTESRQADKDGDDEGHRPEGTLCKRLWEKHTEWEHDGKLLSWGNLSLDTFFWGLKFHQWNGWNNKIFIGFHERTPKFLYSLNKTCKTNTGFLPLLCQMTLAKISSITHRKNRYLPSDAHSLWEIVCKVNFGSTDICRFRTQRFSISKLAVEN